MKSNLVLGSALALLVSSAGAFAATLSLLDPNGEGVIRSLNDNGGTSDFDLDDGPNIAPGWSVAAYNALVPLGTGYSGDDVTVFNNSTKNSGNGVSVNERSRVTFTYLGSEAGFTNLGIELINDTVVFTNKGAGASDFGDTFSFLFGPGLIPFAFETDGNGGGTIANDGGADPSTMEMEIAYSSLFNNDSSINVFFGDSGAGVDGDLDDLGIRIDVAAVPLPAAGWLLLAGIGGLGMVRRFRKA